jgi:chromosome segregation ATPase
LKFVVSRNDLIGSFIEFLLLLFGFGFLLIRSFLFSSLLIVESLREETEKAEAATKAKEAEYADTKLAVAEAKVEKDRAQAEFDRLNKEAENCTNECEELEGQKADAQKELDFAMENFNLADE